MSVEVDTLLACLNAPAVKAKPKLEASLPPGSLARCKPDVMDPALEARIVRPVQTEAKVLDASKGIVRFTASDQTLDSYREIIAVSGWLFNRFRLNPVVVDSHDYSTIEKQLGRVVKYEVTGGELVEDVQFAVDVAECRLAMLAFKLIEAGYLRAVSVGFQPVSYASRYGDEDEFKAAVSQLGLNATTAAIVRTIFLRQEQIELSVCLIGANQNALAKGWKAGVLKDADMDYLADLGQRTLSQPEGPEQSGPASKPAGEAEALARRERAQWLRYFSEATNR